MVEARDVKRRYALLILAAVVGAGAAGYSLRKQRAQERAQARALHAERTSQVIQLLPAHINDDDKLDVVVAYHAAWGDAPGTRFSLLQAFDGASGNTLWTDRLERFLLPTFDDYNRQFVVGKDTFVIAGHYSEEDASGSSELIWVHSLRTGKLVWEHRFPQSEVRHGPFRAWLDENLLLVFSNNYSANNDLEAADESTTSALLYGFELSTGQELWRVPISRSLYGGAPSFVGSNVVMTTTTADPGARLVLVHRDTGKKHEMPISLGEDGLPVVVGNEIFVPCRLRGCTKSEQFEAALQHQCRDSTESKCVGDLGHALALQGWMARFDVSQHALTPVLASNGTIVPLAPENSHVRSLAIYGRTLIQAFIPKGAGSGAQILRASEIDSGRELWTTEFEEGFAIEGLGSDLQKYAPDAAHFVAIQARFLPLLVFGDGAKLLIIDLDTGKQVWTSKAFKVTEDAYFHAPFTFYTGSYYFEVITEVGEVMLTLDGSTGQLTGANQIEVAEGSETISGSPSGWGRSAPSPWYFEDRHLVGSWGGQHLWVIDLEANKLTMSHPSGVTLAHPWDAVEALLGPLPRPLLVDQP